MIRLLWKRVFQGAIVCFLGTLNSYAQLTTQEIESNLSGDQRVIAYQMDVNRGTPSLIKINSSSAMQVSDAATFLADVLGFGTEVDLVSESSTNTRGFQIDKLQQYMNGIKVEHGAFKVISNKGQVIGIAAEYYNLNPSLSSLPTIDEATALQHALNHIGASKYAWEYVQELGSSPELQVAYDELYPSGELVFVDNYQTAAVDVSLAYKFNVYAAEPISRDDIYIDATTGEVLLVDAIIKHAGEHGAEDLEREIKEKSRTTTASGDTRYAGRRNFDTSLDGNGNWVLNGVTPSGIENETRSYEGLAPPVPLVIYSQLISAASVPIADGDGDILNPETADNSWDASEHRKDEFSATNPYPLANESRNDDIALDAHWGAEVVLDYWKNVHNRSSYDDQGTKVYNYVHFGDAYDNAFWNGQAMTYGDGSYQGGTNPDGSFAPLTSMDVCSHEIGHGVCEYTSDLVYQNESGAMNEGFSDIWAAAVEAYVLSEIDGSLEYDVWGIGEQIDERDGGLPAGSPASRALRWMDDPKAEGDPDSYDGENWISQDCSPTLANDQCGVHTNSGVLNKWYYLMVVGSGQPLSPGLNKQSVEDELTDAGNSYHLSGLGFDKASAIAYLSETLLTPNATYHEMRDVSIFVAQSLYGVGSQEEIHTTNAWYAVDIGDQYTLGDPNSITFNDGNPGVLREQNAINGCEDFNVFNIVITGVDVSPSATITLSTAGSSAQEGVDFDLSASSVTFSGSGNQTIQLIVYDDVVMESTETISLSFVHNGEFHQQEYLIVDNDFIPHTGSGSISLLSESFSSEGAPSNWEVSMVSPGNNVWRFNGDLSAEGRAYISDGISNIPFYDQNSPTNTILRTPLIQAGGTSDVTISFDWEAGGETDVLDASVIYDYGEFMYSLDGTHYTSVQQFYGEGPLAANTASGTFTQVINALDGQAFYLAWRWYNDTNAGTQFSFAIDNVSVSAIPGGIETEQGEVATTQVHSGSTIYFVSESDQGLIGRIDNASSDLGCVTLSVIEEGSSFQLFDHINTARPSKAFSIDVENQQATYDLTLYFTNQELTAFQNPITLIPIKVDGNKMNAATDRPVNFQLDGVVTEVNANDNYYAYTGTFIGSGVASIVQDFSYCMDAPQPWSGSDIGNVAAAGTICYMDDAFELAGSGSRIGGKSDSFFFLHQQMQGDGEIIARVNSLQNTHREAKAAVMIRESMDAKSKFAMTTVVSNPLLTGTQVQLEYRNTFGGAAKGKGYYSIQTPEYIRIVRSGNSFTAYVSDTNGNWQHIGSRSVNMGSSVYVGLAVTSRNNGVLSSAEFEEVTIINPGANTRGGVENELASDQVSAFNLYPNPASSLIKLEGLGAENELIEVYGLSGVLMRRAYSQGRASVEIDLTEVPKGIYLLRVMKPDGQTITRKFVKQ